MSLSAFSSATSMSFSDLNVELGKGVETELSMSQAASGFSGIITNRTSDENKYLPGAMELREFYGLTLGQIEAIDLNIHKLYNTSNATMETYQSTELIECAEGVVPTGESGYTINSATFAVTPQAGPSGDLQDGDHLYTSQTNGVDNGVDLSIPSTGDGFVMTTTTDQIFKMSTINSDTEVNTPVLDRKPAQRTTSVYDGSLAANRYGKTNYEITIESSGDSRVARNVRFQRDSEPTYTGTADNVGGSVTSGQLDVDFYGGDTNDSNRASYYTFTGLYPDTSYTFRSRGENAFANGDYSTITAKTYKNTSISISEGADGGDGDGIAGTETLDYLTITVTNSNGTHTPFTGETDINFPILTVNNNGNVKYRQSTTTSFSGNFVTPSQAAFGQPLTLNGSGVVYIQPQLVTSAGFSTFTRTFQVVDGHVSASFQIGEQPGPPSFSTDGTVVLMTDTNQTNGEDYFTDVIEITVNNSSANTINISYPQKTTGTTGNVRQVYYRVASNSSDKLTTFSGFINSTYYGTNQSSAVDDDIPITSGKVYLQFYAQSDYRVATSEYSYGSTTVTLEATNGDVTATTSFSAGVAPGAGGKG